jgi:uncharacterized membrane protein YgdD (TMEM256/DUF423 family)
MARWSAVLVGISGLMGAAGVGLAAWAAHRGGGDMLMTAALFLILHASAVAGMALAARTRLPLASASALAWGSILFSGDLALRFTMNLKPWAQAAPTGGIIMILGWLGLVAAAVTMFRRR